MSRRLSKRRRRQNAAVRRLFVEPLECRRLLAAQIFADVAGSAGFDRATDTAVDNFGNLFVAGTVEGNVTDFAGNSVPGFSGRDPFVAKLDAAGNQQFFKVAGGVSTIPWLDEEVAAIGVDAAGNVYVSGHIDLTASAGSDFAGNSIAATGSIEVFVAKLDGSGTQQYFHVAGGATTDLIVDMSVDASGNVTLAGENNDGATTVDFAGNAVSGDAGFNAFVARLDSSGSQVYYEQAAGSAINELGVSGGSAYVTGTTSNVGTEEDFAGNSLVGFGQADLFVAALDSAGSQQYFHLAGGSGIDNDPHLRVDASGNVTLGGVVSASATTVDFAGNPAAGVGSRDIYVARLDSSGTQQFFRIAGSTSISDNIQDITADDAGNAYVVGFLNSASPMQDFDGNPLSQFGGSDSFIAKVNSSGVQQYFRTFGGPSSDNLRHVAIDDDGNALVAGVSGGPAPIVDFNGNSVSTNGALDIVVAKLDSSGAQQYFKLAGSSSFDNLNSLDVDARGAAYVTGLVQVNGTTFDGTPYTSIGVGDTFVAKIDAGGNQEFFGLAGGSNLDPVESATLGSDGNIYVSGRFFAPGQDFAGNTLTGVGSADLFVARIGTNGLPVAVPDTNSVTEDAAMNTATGNVLANDSDPDLETLTVGSVEGSAANVGSTIGTLFGTVQVDGNGAYTYTLDNGNPAVQALAAVQSVDDVINYTATDGLSSTPSTLTITINGANDNPTANNDNGAAFTTDEDTPFTTGNVLTNDTDLDTSDTLSVLSFNTTATSGIVTSNGNGTFDYDPNGRFDSLDDGQVVTDTFTYTLSDGNGGTDTATVTITISGISDQTIPEEVDDLMEEVEDLLDTGVLNNGQSNPMLNFLDQAIKEFNKGKKDKAIQKLEDFVGRVEDLLDDGTLTLAEGQPLIDAANNIIADILATWALTADNHVARGAATPLSPGQLQPVVEQAAAYWRSAGADGGRLLDVSFEVRDLPGAFLGFASTGVVWIDGDAAGHGWSQNGSGGMDLLSAVTHELGHSLGFDHDHGSEVMAATLGVNQRSVPDSHAHEALTVRSALPPLLQMPLATLSSLDRANDYMSFSVSSPASNRPDRRRRDESMSTQLAQPIALKAKNGEMVDAELSGFVDTLLPQDDLDDSDDDWHEAVDRVFEELGETSD